MPTPARRPGVSRFIAYSTLTRLPVLTGAEAGPLLTATRAIPALGYDNRFVEVLDCGEGGPDAESITAKLDDAREIYRTVFRGAGVSGRPGMPAFPFVEPEPAAPDPASTRAIVDDLSLLAARARRVGPTAIAALLERVLAEVEAELDCPHGA